MQTIVTPNELLIEGYRQDVENLEDPDGLGTEEEIVVITREAIARRQWRFDELAQITRIDELLVSHWQQFEGVLPNPNFQDRTHWWWFLNEGPQLRDEAEGKRAESERVSA